MPQLGSIIALLIAMASIQVGASFAKQLFPIVGTYSAVALRVGWAAVILAVLWRPWKIQMTLRGATSVALYGFSLGLMNLTFYMSLERIPLGIAVGLEFTGPLCLALLSSRRTIDFIWGLLAGAGIFMILPISGISSEIDPLGAILAVVAGGFWALYIVFGKKAGAAVPGGGAAALGMIAAAIAVIPAGAAHADSRLGSPKVWLLGLGLALLSSALPYSLEMIALRRTPARTFSILMSLEPAMAALSGWALLSERLSLLQWAAIFLIMAASAGSSLTSRSSR